MYSFLINAPINILLPYEISYSLYILYMHHFIAIFFLFANYVYFDVISTFLHVVLWANQCCRSGGRLGAEPSFFKLGGGGAEPPFCFRKSRIYYVTEEIQSPGDTKYRMYTHVQERQEET